MQGTAVVATERGGVALQEVALPEPGAEDVVIVVSHSWISNGTERSFILGERSAGDTPWRNGDPSPFPHVPGYQKVGIAAWVGERVRGIRPGDWVFGTISAVSGMAYGTGGHVSPAITHMSQVWRLPADVSPVAVSGAVLTQVGWNAGTRAPDVDGRDALVIGDGLVGLWSAQTLAARGASVIVAGRHAGRLEAAVGTVPHVTPVDTRQEDLVAAVRRTAPRGLRVVVDTVGVVDVVYSLLDLMAHDGHIVSVGFHGERGLIDIQRLRARELTLHSPSGWTRPRMDATLAAIADGRLRTEELVTHHFPVRQAADAYARVIARDPDVLGVVLDW